ncbi:MAG: ATPase, partial [Deltaproteobacteria bacterium]|nr:ATPase [Deltaproteobacteria bacterium]
MEKEFLKKKRYISIFHNPVTAWFILITSLVLTVGAYFLSASFVQQRVEDRFSFRAIEIESAIKDRLRIYEQALWGGVGFMNASNSQVSRQEWAKYVESLKINQHWPGIQGIGFSIPVQPEEKQTHIEKIRSKGFPEYLIKPEGTRGFYTAIIYLEPFDWRNKRAFGYDMWSNEIRRIAMTYARDEGVAATSGIITLVQETKEDVQRGFLTYLPVYRTKTIPKTLKERREQFMGWVYAPFRAGDLMKGITGTEDPNIEFEIFDGDTMSQETLLFDSNPGLHFNQSQHDHDFQKTVRITLQGRPWTIQFNTPDISSENSEKYLPLLVALAGGFVDLLLFYVIYSLYFINRRAETIAKKMTKESRDANEKLIVINANLKKTTV